MPTGPQGEGPGAERGHRPEEAESLEARGGPRGARGARGGSRRACRALPARLGEAPSAIGASGRRRGMAQAVREARCRGCLPSLKATWAWVGRPGRHVADSEEILVRQVRPQRAQ